MKPVVIIFNPVSGTGRSEPLARNSAGALEGLGIPCRLEPTRAAGDGTRIAREWEQRSRALLAVGGDGTIREVSQGMTGNGAPLAVCPAGTANVLVRELGLPARPDETARVIEQGRVRRLDRLEISNGEGRTERGLLFAGVGFDGQAVHHLAHHRHQLIARGGTGNISKLDYLKPLLHTIRSLPPPDLKVTVDGQELTGGPWGWVEVTNLSRYAGWFSFGAGIRPDDGQLDLIAFRAAGIMDLARYGLAGLLDMMPSVDSLVQVPVQREVVIQGGVSRPVQLDGDPAGFSPLTVRRLDSKVPVLVPASKGDPR